MFIAECVVSRQRRIAAANRQQESNPGTDDVYMQIKRKASLGLSYSTSGQVGVTTWKVHASD